MQMNFVPREDRRKILTHRPRSPTLKVQNIKKTRFSINCTMSRILYAFCTLLVIISSIIADESKQEKLRFVTVVFRHGDRAPDNNGEELYPTDPYLHYNFFPMGLGGLTNTGKLREYRLGEKLRERYHEFLGSTYLPQDIVARSTDYRRTKMSLSLVLAALFPPNDVQKWNSRLRWQPIPTACVSGELDSLLIPEDCPLYLKKLKSVQSLPEVVKRVQVFKPLMKALSNYTGKNITNTNQMYYLYHDLMAEKSMNLTLPSWTQNLFPYGALWDATVLEYDIVSYNDELKRLNGGTLLKRIVDDTTATLNNDTIEGRKMNIFSGHETNIAALLQTLGVYKSHVPEYASAVLVELVDLDGSPHVRVLYFSGIPDNLQVMTIPGCAELCPIEDFLRLLQNVIPSGDELRCEKASKTHT